MHNRVRMDVVGLSAVPANKAKWFYSAILRRAMRIDAAATVTRASRGPIFGILLLPIHDLPTRRVQQRDDCLFRVGFFVYKYHAAGTQEWATISLFVWEISGPGAARSGTDPQ